MTLADTLKANQCTLLLEETSENEIRDLEKDLPTDLYLVVTDQGVYGVRAWKSSDIFDSFFDEGHQVQEIRAGFGRIKPNLFQG